MKCKSQTMLLNAGKPAGRVGGGCRRMKIIYLLLWEVRKFNLRVSSYFVQLNPSLWWNYVEELFESQWARRDCLQYKTMLINYPYLACWSDTSNTSGDIHDFLPRKCPDGCQTVSIPSNNEKWNEDWKTVWNQ